MSAYSDLADRLEKCPACIDYATPQRMKFIAGFAMTEKDRQIILTALRGADALAGLKDLPPAQPKARRTSTLRQEDR